MKKYYYLYQITNKINGHIYIGVHQTNNLNDGYMGSGIYLKKAFKKYGKENFEKVILEYFDNENDMYQREKEIVNEEFLKRRDVYNALTGGIGFGSKEAGELSRKNWENPEKNMAELFQTEEFREARRQDANKRYADPEYKERWLKTVQSDEYREKISKITKEKLADPQIHQKLLGDRRSPEYLQYLSNLYKEKWKDPDYREKMSNIIKGKKLVSCPINNLSIYVEVEEIIYYLKSGWILGYNKKSVSQ